MIKKSVCMSLLMIAGVAVFAITPLPKILNQSKVDKLINDYDNLNKSGVLNAEFQKAQQEISSTLFNDPSVVAELSLSPLKMAFILMCKTAEQVKKSSIAKAELAKYQWTNEYWDMLVVISFGIQYEQILASYKQSGADTGNNEDGETVGMKSISDYMDKSDYVLVMANEKKIMKAMERKEEIHQAANAG